MAVRTPLLCAALVALPLAATAQSSDNGLSYTYLEAGYINLDVDAFDDNASLVEDFDDGSGYAIRGSFAFTRNVFAFAGYSVTDSDVTFADEDNFLITESEDIKRFDVGLGASIPLTWGNRPTDAVVRAAYVDVDFGDFDFGASGDSSLGDLDDDSSDGWAADAQLRSQLLDRLEASVGVGYLDIEDSDGVSFLAGLLFELTPNWGIDLDANIGDEVSYYMLGVRYSFERF